MIRNEKIYQFKLGELTCTIIKDAELASNPEQLFLNDLSLAETKAIITNRGFDLQNLIISYNYLLVDTGEQKILFDTGNGRSSTPQGTLVANLASIDIQPTDIDMVIISHGHPDHYGGLTDDDENLVFSNATHMMFDQELNDWTSDEAIQQMETDQSVYLHYVRPYLLPVKDQIETFTLDSLQLSENITAMPTHGHSDFHMSFVIESNGEKLIYAGDVALHPLHFTEDWRFAADFNHEKADQSRENVLQWSLENNGLVMLCHYDFPGLGRFSQAGSEYEWTTFSP